MGTVIVDLSMSLDGFIAGAGDGMSAPLGKGGEALFAWMEGPERNRVHPYIAPVDGSKEIVDEWMRESGSILSGRRTFDVAGGWAPPEGHPAAVPIVVLTHNPPTEGRWNEQLEFATDLHEALRRAQELAGDKVVAISGASIAKQLLREGLLDEIQVSVAPILLGGGVRLFEDFGDEPIALEQTRVVASEGVTHLRYRVIR